ncbi:hypothetical protein [Mycobacterium mantenii]|uniref:Uncharacterized protein n=1 Tax=Mycobacterium mantenii TaxID=560555 RepID=A0A1A2SR23_MYCNT|nr:hypothetical protein [Mycobacterium mantenii]OBH45859.1 hypothetical protein A5688_06565 [Mycobacterium mantenii]OBH66212.1 hypothetical protein A5683_10980 [Mycobacterium mantenii]OBH67891.1 hypothetical protein A5682_12445 [Mycobacterium mantenii]
MTTNTPRPTVAGGRRRRLLLGLAGAAVLAVLALYDAAQPQTAGIMPGSGSVRPTDLAVSPQAPPGIAGGGFAADDDDDQAQLQQQLNQQQLQQSMQQAEQQNEQAQQQFNQDMQQQQTYENQFNNP